MLSAAESKHLQLPLFNIQRKRFSRLTRLLKQHNVSQPDPWTDFDLHRRRWAIRSVGIVSLIMGLIFIVPAFSPIGHVTVCAIARFSPSLVLFVLGIGVLFLRRSAALALALITVTAGLWVTIGSLLELPFAEIVINLIYGAGYFVPSIVFIWARRGFKGW